jgi:hypothetical protein
MPAVVAPWFASFPVICGETEEDSLFARGENDTSDKNPDNMGVRHIRAETIAKVLHA